MKQVQKEMISSILSQHYCVLKTEGNYNNEIGLAYDLQNTGRTRNRDP